MTWPRLYAIVDVEAAGLAADAAINLARAYLAAGVRLLQLRAKTMNGAALLELASLLATEAHAAGARLIINDRADIAVLAGADGVHVGQDDLPPGAVRRLVGPDAIVGLSTHTTAQIEQALTEPIDYLAIGPVFATTTKATGYEAVGYDAVRQAHDRVRARDLPVVAIGGITLDTAPEVVAAGATAVAVITDLMTPDPGARARAYLARLSG